VFLSAGEHSGDSHGAALAKRLRDLDPEMALEGLGGPLMREAGVRLHLDLVEHAAMGVIPVLKKGPFFLRTIRETAERILADPPDVFVPIDINLDNFDLETARDRMRTFIDAFRGDCTRITENLDFGSRPAGRQAP
jgi:lipid A disaccharide synthetase